MAFRSFLIGWLGLVTIGAEAATPFEVSVPPLIRESRLRLGYRITCPAGDSPLLHALEIVVRNEPEIYRYPLFRNLSTIEVPLTHSRDARELQIHPRMRARCEFRLETSELVHPDSGQSAIDVQARIHAPVLVPRWDQWRNRWTDVPLRLYYSVVEPKGTSERILRYTAIFSDEDSLATTPALERQIAAYGRRLDIEWVYEVRLDRMSGHVLARFFQGAQIAGIGHRTRPFRGRYLKDSLHPLLYVIARHNVFSDRPELPFGAPSSLRSFLPLHGEIPAPSARENVLLAEPWLVQAGDQELRRKFGEIRPATEWFYVRVRGAPPHRALQAFLRWRGKLRPVGAWIRRIGLDLFGRESWISFRVDRDELAEILDSRWSIVWKDRRGRIQNGPDPVQGYHLFEDSNRLYRWESSAPAGTPYRRKN